MLRCDGNGVHLVQQSCALRHSACSFGSELCPVHQISLFAKLALSVLLAVLMCYGVVCPDAAPMMNFKAGLQESNDVA